MRVIFATCTVRYTGRIDAELELGDRLILCKEDGTVVLHAATGLQPRNWMPAGSEWVESPGLITVTHERRGERLEIYLSDGPSFSRQFEPKLNGRLIKLGSEREFSDLISCAPDEVEVGLSIVAREYRTKVGPVDLFALDANGEPVVIEVKRRPAQGVEVAYQILRYQDAIRADPQWAGATVRGILVAPGLSRPLSAALAEHRLGFVRLNYETLLSRLESGPAGPVGTAARPSAPPPAPATTPT
ncbi:endonuclease NucS domain-containing protein [Miltoncostaea oceani]|uniref:endonuclease NucS domain-containing protein n=1 Tax=Miltoncostaea oceani TaxID=2843216 RepID=UPI001C3E1903|nr:endonuclease NucS domain-containing protein [Miltoncostaea oceani]